MSPPEQRFPTTDLTLISILRHREGPDADVALNKLCQRYWAPIHSTLQQMGPEARSEAQDWTQEFLAGFAVRHGGFTRLDKSKARLRTFLQTSLKNFVINKLQKIRTVKAGGRHPHVPLEEAPVLVDERETDARFDCHWACEVLRRAEERVRRTYRQRERWEIIKPFLFAPATPGAYTSLAEGGAGRSADALKVEVCRARTAYRAAIRAEVIATVGKGVDINAEVHYLISCLAHAPAGR